MARLEEAIFDILKNSSAVSNLIGQRIYPIILPQNCTLPAVTYEKISTLRESGMGGDPNVAWARMQINYLADTFSESQSGAEEIRKYMTRRRGTNAAITIEDIWPDNESADYDPETDSYRSIIDFLILYRESST